MNGGFKTQERKMTREYFDDRWSEFMTTLIDCLDSGRVDMAERFYGRICELCDLAFHFGLLDLEEYTLYSLEAENLLSEED